MAKPSASTVINSDWLTLAEVIAQTGKSQSTIERWVGTGFLPSKLEARPGRKPERLYAASALASLHREGAEGRALTLTSRSVAAPPRPAPGPTEIALAPKTAATLSELVELWLAGQRRPPVVQTLWLSIDEATALSGIPKTSLKALLKEGKISSTRFGRAVRIRRRDLEAFEG